MIPEIYIFVLIALEDGPRGHKGTEIRSTSLAFSEKECEDYARAGAQGIYAIQQQKFGFRCERIGYVAPKVE